MRLIDASATKVSITRFFEVHISHQKSKRLKEHSSELCRDMCFAIDVSPTVDAVEVVRCENCKHFKKSEVSDRMMCWRKDVDGQPVCYDFNPNDFCSYGERRSDGR